MDYVELSPAPALSDLIQCYWSAEGTTRDALPEVVLPDGRGELVINLGDPFLHVGAGGSRRQPALMAVGQISQSITLVPTGRIRLFGIRFTPWGQSAALRVSGAALRDRWFSADLAEGLVERAHERDRTAIDTHIGELFAGARTDAQSRTAAGLIERSYGAVSISRLAETLGVSRRTLERRFMEHVGLPPKRFARIARLRRVLELTRAGAGWARAAALAGYFDQAHLTRDFRELTGLTPAGLMGNPAGFGEALRDSGPMSQNYNLE